MKVWQSIDDLLDKYDADVQFETRSQCAWSGQLRVTLTNPDGLPSRSMTFFSAGGTSSAEVARKLLADFKNWRREADAEPLPVPDWMRS